MSGVPEKEIYEVRKRIGEPISDGRDKISMYLTEKLYPLPYVNNKGYRIGNYHVLINKDKLPFSSIDQVDHFLLNLFNYVKAVPSNNKPAAEFNKEFFKNYKEDVLMFTPIRHKKDGDVVEKRGGKKHKRKTKAKSKKNRTRKNRY
jgi:hypothetical protein